MGESLRGGYTKLVLAFCVGFLLVWQPTNAQPLSSPQTFRSSFGALMDSYDRVFQQENDMRGQAAVARAKTAMADISDEELAKIFSQAAPPDLTTAVAAMQRLGASSQDALKPGIVAHSMPLPGAPTVIDSCINTPHGDQITYDALIAFQVTSGILAAAAWVCNEDINGENGSLACVPLAIANDIASSLFAVRQFCQTLDSNALIAGSYDRLDHIHTDLSNARSDIINNENANTTSLMNAINAGNSANTAAIINELHALGCEIIRLLNTPDGQKASSILACSAQPGFPYRWGKR